MIVALNDSVSKNSSEKLDKMIPRLHDLYKMSPRKFHLLRDLVDMYGGLMKFSEGCY